MNRPIYLLDTHALIFWATATEMSPEFLDFLDEQDRLEHLLVSSISFWEIALLTQKGKLTFSNLHQWKDELLKNTHLQLINPTVAEMIDATLLPPHHKDPFDRLLIVQAINHEAWLVSKDSTIAHYEVEIFWMSQT